MGKVHLPIWRTLRSALLIVTERRGALFNALLAPALLIVFLNLAFQLGLDAVRAIPNDAASNSQLVAAYAFAGTLLLSLGNGLLSAVFAVSCHRITLLGVAALPNKWGLYWSRRETRFFGWIFLFAIPMLLTTLAYFQVSPLVIKMLPLELPLSDTSMQVWRALYSLSLTGMTIIVTATFGLVLPLTAIDKNAGLLLAWRQVRGNILRLAVVLAIPMLLTWGISQVFYGLLAGAGGDVMTALFRLGFMLIGAFEVIVLSVSYQQLVNSNGHAPPAPSA